ncbi:hypothetical protein V5799_021457 [Amblyomma americanum]|uniref:Uncharacterized protein n=1 Tax=Amblyomma americanum TaxID=6943 RepID=A0AAQ4FN76_AMBAM
MVRKHDTLRLLMFSPGIEDQIPNCLISKYLSKTSKGARRTLETNFIGKGKELLELKSRVQITVTNGTEPYLQAAYLKAGPHRCTLWGYKHSITCHKIFVIKCRRGRPVDLTKCTEPDKKKVLKLQRRCLHEKYRCSGSWYSIDATCKEILRHIHRQLKQV